MSADQPNLTTSVLLVGNPNAGKTMLFNKLTGLSAKVANYPGITVDVRKGSLRFDSRRLAELYDLPGTYSLIPCSEDEEIAVKGVLGELAGTTQKSSLIVAVVSATSLKRNMYLVSQLLELRRPTIVAVTMMDAVDSSGLEIDVTKLSSKLNVPVVALSAVRGDGLEELRKKIEEEVNNIEQNQNSYVEKSDKDFTNRFSLSAGSIKDRYEKIDAMLEGVVRHKVKNARRRFHPDDFLLHQFWGVVFLLLIFGSMLNALFLGSAPLIGAIEEGVLIVSETLRSMLPESSLFASLIIDGVIAGVGSVIVFIPLIGILFLFIGLLEDSGYLARATFLLDRVMAKAGLSGKSFVPLMSGFACAVPAIMSTRVIPSKKERILTILVTPLMSCSARLPVYGLLIAAVFATAPPFFGFLEVGAVVMLSMYALGIVVAFIFAFCFKKLLFKGDKPTLVLELPPYRMPRWYSVFKNVFERIQIFLREAGTVILAMTVILWGLFTFPLYEADSRISKKKASATVSHEHALHQLEHSYAGQIGRFIEPAVSPLGFDWKIGVALLSSFAAREVFVSTLGVVYGLGHEEDETSMTLKEAIRNEVDQKTGKPRYTPLVALSLMVFFALAMQCISTLAVTKRETKSIKWPLFQFGYLTFLAWLSSFIVFQTGTWLGF